MNEDPELQLTDEMKIIKATAVYYINSKYSGISGFVSDVMLNDFATTLGVALEDYRSGRVI